VPIAEHERQQLSRFAAKVRRRNAGSGTMTAELFGGLCRFRM